MLPFPIGNLLVQLTEQIHLFSSLIPIVAFVIFSQFRIVVVRKSFLDLGENVILPASILLVLHRTQELVVLPWPIVLLIGGR